MLSHLSIILVCGPAGGGKSTLAAQLAEALDCPVVATDSYKHMPWDEVPLAVGESLALFDEPGSVVVLEGVRALSAVQKCGVTDRVREVIWVEVGAEKPGTAGMTTRQRNLLAQMQDARQLSRIITVVDKDTIGCSHAGDFAIVALAERIKRGAEEITPMPPAMYFIPKDDQ